MSYAIFVGSVQSLIPPDGLVASARPPLRFPALVMAHVPPGSQFNQQRESTATFLLMNPSFITCYTFKEEHLYPSNLGPERAC